MTKSRKYREAEEALEKVKREAKRKDRPGVGMFDPAKNVGPSGESEIKLVVLPREGAEQAPAQGPVQDLDVLGDSFQDAFNLAASVNPMPS